jgi:ABC-type transport system substrate-binding protein
MSDPAEFVTVYRSMDASAKQDCETIVNMLAAEGISAAIRDDSSPGVPQGAFDVQVPAPDAAKAEKLIDENPLPDEVDEVEEVDDSPALDMETIFRAVGTTAEMRAMGIKSVLEANGIATVLVCASVLPYLPFEVRVARDQVERARELIDEAQTLGPAAAEEAEIESEGGAPVS